MKNLFKSIFIVSLFMLPTICFAENENNSPKKEDVSVKVIDREDYQVQIKQYNKD